MNLDELREMIIQTSDDDWHQLTVGPYFHDRIYVAGDLDFNGTSHSHYYRAVLKSNVNVSLEWGMDDGNDEDENHLWQSEAGFPDPRVSTQVLDVFLFGALVDRTSLIAVDGHRAYLPNYSVVRVDGGDPVNMDGAVFEYHASRWNFYVAQLINQLAGHREFESYVRRSGIKLVS